MQGLDSILADRKNKHLYRKRHVIGGPQGAEVIVDGCQCINFCSNDYLGLANHPAVISAFQKASNAFGVGSGASHLVCGHSTMHQQLEEELADFTGRDRALLFSTGYMANLGVVTALLGKKDFIFEDKLNHASLLDAGILSGAHLQRFKHSDLRHLKSQLEKSNDGRRLVAVDGVFSMDGDIAALDQLALLAQENNSWLMVDDAHGFGVLGKTGAGCAEHFNLDQKQLPVLMATLGKAFGSFGAFIAGSEALIETLIQFSRSYIYTTALPPAVAAASLASLDVIRTGSERRDKLQSLITRFREGAIQIGLNLMPSDTAIQPLFVGDNEQAVSVSEQLLKKGFLIGAIRPPTVPVGTARLRITLTAAHSEKNIDYLLDALSQVLTSE